MAAKAAKSAGAATTKVRSPCASLNRFLLDVTGSVGMAFCTAIFCGTMPAEVDTLKAC